MSTAASSKAPKRAGKENAPPVKSKLSHAVTIDEDGDDFDDLAGDDMNKVTKPASRSASSSFRTAKAGSTQKNGSSETTGEDSGGKGKGSEDLQRRLIAVTAERDRYRDQRNTFSKQFEELSKSRNTDVESLFEKYKENAGVQAKAQSDVIDSLTTLNEKLQAKVQALEKSLKEVNGLSGKEKADPKEVKALKSELAKAQEVIREKDVKFAELDKIYKAEVEQSRSLLSKSTTGGNLNASTAVAAATTGSGTEAEEDQACVTLYEDMTDFNITACKIKVLPKGNKEYTFNCIQTYMGRSLNFKLRSYQIYDKATTSWIRQIRYTPEQLEHEVDKEFVSRLGVFADEWECPRDQLAGLWNQMKIAIRGDDGEGEGDVTMAQ